MIEEGWTRCTNIIRGVVGGTTRSPPLSDQIHQLGQSTLLDLLAVSTFPELSPRMVLF